MRMAGQPHPFALGGRQDGFNEILDGIPAVLFADLSGLGAQHLTRSTGSAEGVDRNICPVSATGMADPPIRKAFVALRGIILQPEGRTFDAAAPVLESGAGNADHLHIVFQRGHPAGDRSADIVAQPFCRGFGFVGLVEAVEQDRADIERQHLELQAQRLDKGALIGDFGPIPATGIIKQLQIGTGIDHHMSDAELHRQFQPVGGGIDDLFADIHVWP